ncbi:hypothetical protein PCASD_07088 [Puccinia coronata f. sp. avenae]|uniref:Uncharacterized protein n=1 Tax=Puccinia coronata f. sp. avenae TaxID=200324 RepID=A0A2N5SNC1_9BASI|nr:hypothetical protein PCASD_18774 [Puccinia coronata f. sp. avenae]PLW45653.1 hypothetical protein PCASD_07088 [Puccinia coronata f. sp. avenae]
MLQPLNGIRGFLLWGLHLAGLAMAIGITIRGTRLTDGLKCLLDFSNLEHTLILLFATFSAASLSLVAITILQFKHTNTLMAQDPLHLCHESGPSI